MEKILTTSDSLVGSLCREIYNIRQRYKNIINSLDNCRDKNLIQRLNKEINDLNTRRIELIEISNKVQKDCKSNASILFLHELCVRSL